MFDWTKGLALIQHLKNTRKEIVKKYKKIVLFEIVLFFFPETQFYFFIEQIPALLKFMT